MVIRRPLYSVACFIALHRNRVHVGFTLPYILGVYDDPWNVEQVQQEIFDQLERQKQKTAQHESRPRRASEELANERVDDIFAVPQHIKRLVRI